MLSWCARNKPERIKTLLSCHLLTYKYLILPHFLINLIQNLHHFYDVNNVIILVPWYKPILTFIHLGPWLEASPIAGEYMVKILIRTRGTEEKRISQCSEINHPIMSVKKSVLEMTFSFLLLIRLLFVWNQRHKRLCLDYIFSVCYSIVVAVFWNRKT